MTKQRIWRTKNQGLGAINETPLRSTIHPPLMAQPATLLWKTVLPEELAMPRVLCLIITVLIPSCIYSAIWGLTNSEAILAQTESLSWESQQSKLKYLGGLNATEWERNSKASGMWALCPLRAIFWSGTRSTRGLSPAKSRQGRPAAQHKKRLKVWLWNEVQYILQTVN